MNEYIYYPILKWKQGEYRALRNLRPEIKDRVCPIIEIPPVGYDQESRENRITLDAHIKDIGIRLHNNWEDRISFIDVSKLDIPEIQKPLYIKKIFDNCSNSFCRTIPVVSLGDGEQSLSVYKEIIEQQKRGCMLRVKISEIEDELTNKIMYILKKLNITTSEIYLLADLERLHIEKENEEEIYNLLSGELCKLINSFSWNTIIIAGSSFPEEITYGQQDNRYEWKFYKNFLDKIWRLPKEPRFADYYVLTPDHSFPIDGKKVKPKAKLRYTTDAGWYFDTTPTKSRKRKDVNEDDGNIKSGNQYKLLCQKLVNYPFFRGKYYSKGDEYIYEQATNLQKSGGNPSKWIEASTDQHITKVVNDLSNLFGFSLRCEQGLLGLLEKTLE